MIFKLQNFFLFTVLIGQCHGYAKPFMKPFGSKLELNPGELLEITCVSWRNITFLQPPPTELLGVKSTKGIIEISTRPHTWIRTLRKPSTSIADSGFYGCANDNVDVDVTKHDQKNVVWIEVIVTNW